ncbi:hypothetical protein ACFL4G_08750 [Thermodesulfobacteriota bacterium]
MSKDLKTLVLLLVGLSFFFMAGTAEADSMCNLHEMALYDFPGSMWTIIAGDWVADEEDYSVQASHDPSAGDYGAATLTHVGEGYPDLLLYIYVSFIGEVAGEIVLLINVGPDLDGYAFSLDGDNDRLKLWRAKINADGSMENLGTLAVTEDVVFTADQRYSLLFKYSDDLDLTGTLGGVGQVHAQVTEMPDGGVAIAYAGSGTANFQYLCIGTTTGLCFIERALGTSLHLDPRTIRRLLPILILLGLIGIFHEIRTQARRGF